MRDEHLFIAELLEKYPDLNPEEREQFNRWLEQGNNKDFFNPILDKEILEEELRQLDDLKIESEQRGSWEKLLQFRIGPLKAKTIRLNNWRLYAAASIIILAFIGYKWFIKGESTVIKETPVVVQNNDVAPGQFKAKLTLADGSVVVLDTLSSTKLVQQGSTTVYTKDGQLVYQPQGKKKGEVLYNTLTTAKAQMYSMVLSDGSKVWLNAQSTLRYPVAFSGEERKVEITGEAYFEVATVHLIAGKDQSKKLPFIVSANGMEVEVLGTKFNINSYSDENAVKTTLLEGKVSVRSKSNKAETVLQPGQQANLDKNSQQLNKLDDVDVDEAVAWHYGYFKFNNANLPTVMRQLARWYDMQVKYEGIIADENFEFLGKIPRNMNLSQVLSILEKQDVHFRIDGKNIIVKP